MKTTKLTTLLSAILLLALGVGCNKSSKVLDEVTANNAIVTSYSDREITREEVTNLLKAACKVQPAREITPWRFVAVGPDKLKTLNGLQSISPGVGNAKAAIVVCGISARMGEGDALDLWQQDCAAATENIILSARARGMGANWLRIYPMTVRVRQVAEALRLDPGVVPFAIISLGYPEATEPVKDQWKPDEIQWVGSFPE